MRASILILVVFLLFGQCAILNAQTDEKLFQQMLEDDQNAIDALVMYPDDVRLSILEAAKYPEALIKMESMQKYSSTAFQDLLAEYTQEVQQTIWDLTRYPGLIKRLVWDGKGKPSAIKELLNDYPQVIHDRAFKAGTEYYPVLERIDGLQDQSDYAFNNLLQDYPAKSQDAFNSLIELPEVLSILTDNIRMTLLLGDIYQRKPDWVWKQLEDLSLEAARERARELDDWKQSLESDPQAAAELQSSAAAFSSEYGYDDEYYPDEDIYYNNEVEVVYVERYYHYPYWVGYPYWYVYPRWRPYPYWYDWGFYPQPGNTIVVIGLPSFYFTNWYFYHPNHWYHYPHLTNHFVGHYYGHRSSVGSIVSGVDRWRTRHQPVLTDDWLADPNHRVDRIKEFGQFEEARQNYNRQHPDKALSERTFLEKNTRKYPNLSKELPKMAREQPNTVQPKPTYQRPTQERIKPSTEPVRKERPNVIEKPEWTQPKTVPRSNPIKDYEKIDKAKEYHQQSWEKNKPIPRVSPPENTIPKTQPRVSPPKNTIPKTQPRVKTPPPKGKNIPREKGSNQG